MGHCEGQSPGGLCCDAYLALLAPQVALQAIVIARLSKSSEAPVHPIRAQVKRGPRAGGASQAPAT